MPRPISDLEKAFRADPHPGTLLLFLKEKDHVGSLKKMTQKNVESLLKKAGFTQCLVGENRSPRLLVSELFREIKTFRLTGLLATLLGEDEGTEMKTHQDKITGTKKAVRIGIGKLLQDLFPFGVSSSQDLIDIGIIFPHCSRIIVSPPIISRGETKIDFQHLHHLSCLRELKVDPFAEIDNEDLISLKSLRSLTSLHLRGGGYSYPRKESNDRIPTHRIDDEGMAHIAQIRQLMELDVSKLPITDQGIEHLRTLLHLTQLNLSKTDISDNALRIVGSLPELKDLDISDTEVGDDGIEFLSEAKKLEKISVARTNISDAALATIARHFQQLHSLSLAGGFKTDPNITDRGFSELPSLPALRSLCIGHLPVTSQTMAHLSRIPSLRSLVLNIDNDAISEVGLTQLQSSPSLRKVIIFRMFSMENEDKLKFGPVLDKLRKTHPKLRVQMVYDPIKYTELLF